VRAADEHGNPVGGVAVTWSASSGSIQASSTTDAQGLASATMTMGHGIGPATARASLSNGAAVAFTAIAFPGTPTTLTWKVEPSNVAAAAPITPALQVAIVDAFGNITNSGSPIVLTLAGGGSDVTLGGTTTKNATNGVATFSDLSVNRDGTYTLTASMQAIHASVSSASFTVTAGAPSRFSITAGDGQTATVNTIVPVAPAVRLLDASNNPVAGARITFAPGTGRGSVTPSDGVATTDANGVATLGSWKLGTTAGAQTLTVTGDGLQSLTLHATATAGAPAAQQWRVQPSNATANATIVPPMQVAIVDAFGNLTPATSAVTLALGGTTDAVLGGTLTRNAVAGVATFNDVTVNRAGTGVTLVATTAGLTTSAASSSFTVVAAAPANLTVSAGNNQSAVVGTAVATPPAVRLVDASGDPIVGATITFTPGSGSGSMSPSDGVVKTNAQGVAALTAWTLGTAAGSSNNTLVASAGGSISATFTASATPGALQHFAVEAAGGGPIQTQVAGAPFGIRVTAQDAYNNTVTNFAGTVDVTSNRPASAGLATSASFVAGVLASHSITLTQEGTNATITVTRSGGAESGTSNPFAVNSGSVSRFDVEAAGGGSIANQVAGTPFALRITARDANGNVVTGFNGVVDVSSNRTGSAGLTTTAAFTAGVLASQSITLTQAGTGTTISVHSGPQIGASNTFIVSPAPLHQFLVEGQNGGAIGAQVAGAPFTVRLTAEDQFGNAVADFAGTADITSTGTITSGSGTTPPFTNGVATRSITIGNAGTFTITATHTGGSEAGTSAAFSVTAGVLHHFRVEAAGGGTLGAQTAGVPFALRVTAQDANNNTVT
jgi:hypothetical protein